MSGVPVAVCASAFDGATAHLIISSATKDRRTWLLNTRSEAVSPHIRFARRMAVALRCTISALSPHPITLRVAVLHIGMALLGVGVPARGDV